MIELGEFELIVEAIGHQLPDCWSGSWMIPRQSGSQGDLSAATRLTRKIHFRRWQSSNRNRLRDRDAEERAGHAERKHQLEFQQQRREVERHVASSEAADAHPRSTRRLLIRTLVKGDVATGRLFPFGEHSD